MHVLTLPYAIWERLMRIGQDMLLKIIVLLDAQPFMPGQYVL